MKSQTKLLFYSPIEAYLSCFQEQLQNTYFYRACFIGLVCSAFFLRALLSRYPYSGKDDPPKFGDFEAQRHWLEITLNLPFSQWYFYDLSYWGLDYPPLTAYVSWFFGKIAHLINPTWVALDSSRGIQTNALVAYMRGTVLFCDTLLYLPSIAYFIQSTMHSFSPVAKLVTLAHLLFFPPLLLIDHSHFQYNSVMLALFVLSITWMIKSHYLKSAMAFSVCLLFKQMSLYFALPIFVFLLRQCIIRNQRGFVLFCQLGLTVISVFCLLLYPFRNDLVQVVHRIFPVNRGIFEDKVASFWCTFSPETISFFSALLSPFPLALALESILPIYLPFLFMVIGYNVNDYGFFFFFSLFSTLFASIPSLYALYRHPTISVLLHSCTSVAMAFFIFSFHVHEKTILLPLMPWLLSMPFTLSFSLSSQHKSSLITFLPGLICMASFSLFPLIKKEKSTLAYVGLQSLYFMFFMPRCTSSKLLFVFLVLFHMLEFLFPPPAQYPDLWTVLNLTISFSFFFLAWGFTTFMSFFNNAVLKKS